MLGIWMMRARRTRMVPALQVSTGGHKYPEMGGKLARQAKCNSGPQKISVMEVLLKVRP